MRDILATFLFWFSPCGTMALLSYLLGGPTWRVFFWIAVAMGIFNAWREWKEQRYKASPEYKAELERMRQERAEREAAREAACEARRVENFVVYSAMCIPTGKCYVGQTTRGLETRKAKHYENAHKGSTECPLFYKALRQYPPHNWKWSIIGRAKSIDELNTMEINAIAKYSRHPHGYNWHPGGDISD